MPLVGFALCDPRVGGVLGPNKIRPFFVLILISISYNFAFCDPCVAGLGVQNRRPVLVLIRIPVLVLILISISYDFP